MEGQSLMRVVVGRVFGWYGVLGVLDVFAE